ncbi:MAG TPA: 2OG-Fe(II) oxygenase, partial [Pseudomonadota bacterium]|nr:2OG-Fe(II) oxygenase [Pseudomonadota bacterium]
LDRYPIDRPEAPEFAELVGACREELIANGMFNLHGFVRPSAIARAAGEIRPLSDGASFTHRRLHNVYFEEQVADLPADHGALARFQTVNRTLCDDQLQGTLVHAIYEYAPLPAFLSRVLEKPRLFLMSDPLARVNVMDYRRGETLNWHFDRCLFTTTLLIQAAEQGGEFEYRTDLRTDEDPNYEGVAQVLRGSDPNVRINPLAAGTLNVFAGENTLHRVSTVRGNRNRLVAVYSYYERPGAMFSEAERIGFYGRTACTPQ